MVGFRRNEFAGSSLFILVALIPAVLIAWIVQIAQSYFSGTGYSVEMPGNLVMIAVYALLVGELLLFTAVVPVLLLLQRLEVLNRWSAFLVASVLPVSLALWDGNLGMFAFLGIYCYTTYGFYFVLCKKWL